MFAYKQSVSDAVKTDYFLPCDPHSDIVKSSAAGYAGGWIRFTGEG